MALLWLFSNCIAGLSFWKRIRTLITYLTQFLYHDMAPFSLALLIQFLLVKSLQPIMLTEKGSRDTLIPAPHTLCLLLCLLLNLILLNLFIASILHRVEQTRKEIDGFEERFKSAALTDLAILGSSLQKSIKTQPKKMYLHWLEKVE